MDFQKLKHLLAVVEHGTFSRAAEAVNLSQPALSRSIQALETELGLPLLDRGTRRLRLTAYGACAVERAPHAPRRDRATARTQAHARRRIRQPQHRPESHSGLVAAVSPAGPYDGAPSAGARQRELGATDALLALLRAERIDALVCDARLLHDAPDIYAQPLAPLRAGLVCRAGHPILAHRRVGVAQIRQYPVASTSLSPEVSLRLAETLGPGGAPEQMVTVRCENLEALTRWRWTATRCCSA